jgi:hypothetical protein
VALKNENAAQLAHVCSVNLHKIPLAEDIGYPQRIMLLYICNNTKRTQYLQGSKLTTQHKVAWATQQGINHAEAVVHNTQRIRDSPDGEPSSSSEPLSVS